MTDPKTPADLLADAAHAVLDAMDRQPQRAEAEDALREALDDYHGWHVTAQATGTIAALREALDNTARILHDIEHHTQVFAVCGVGTCTKARALLNEADHD